MEHIEKYIVERLHELEDTNRANASYITELQAGIKKYDDMTKLLQKCFVAKKGYNGGVYIDRLYSASQKDIQTLINFFEIPTDEEDDE